MTTNVQFQDRTIEIDGQKIELEHPIQEAFRDQNRILVLFDPDAAPGKVANLVCIGLRGERLWVAELPDPAYEDYYYRIETRDPLVAYSFTSYGCEIDPNSGKIVSKEFFK